MSEPRFVGPLHVVAGPEGAQLASAWSARPPSDPAPLSETVPSPPPPSPPSPPPSSPPEESLLAPVAHAAASAAARKPATSRVEVTNARVTWASYPAARRSAALAEGYGVLPHRKPM